MSAKMLLVFGVITVLIVGIAFFFLRSDKEPGPSGDSSGLIVGNNAIYVSEQAPGDSVSVSVVRLSRSGFVVVHEDAAGAPGRILGVSDLLPSGETKDLPAISLSRATIDGETIYAMLHFDNGDSGFDAATDKPALDPVGGEPVMMVVDISKDAIESGVIQL